MSERILKALMQLFAIIAYPKGNSNDRKPIVESFLNQQLNKELVDEYLTLYDQFYEQYQKKQSVSQKQKFTAVSSVKVLMICTVINQELTQKQKIVVLIRLLEFINTEGEITNQELEFVSTVSDTFNIHTDEFESLKQFVLNSNKTLLDSEQILLINSESKFSHPRIKHIYSEYLKGQILIFHINSVNMHVFVFQGENELYLNGQLLHPNRVYVLSLGSSIRNSKIKPIYYSDIISTYHYDKSKSRIVFEVNNLEYVFKNGKVGLHKMSIIEKSGKLVGIMGASGAGKTTLLNVLNGSIEPTVGEVMINGINIHTQSKELEGLIGFVSQDDLLIEELTVFENLYYNAKLCFDNYSNFQLYRTVLRLLKNLGLYEIKDMKVGNPLNKKISGGQRKRLNIALELIREPAVLFLDEPTSGLSSRDSENILDLLKELTLKGKLVFVVIHQPSSDIFKMFDKLIILDTGGYLIYGGDPVDSIVYFKSRMRQANWNDSECPVCGNVNPEQIFNIVESRVIDEYGNLTHTRKTSPKEWNEHYQDFTKLEKSRSILVRKLPEISFKVPRIIKQFTVFIKRDVKSKLSNNQYVAINFLESPVLALILAFIIKYYDVDPNNEYGYTLYNNSNLTVYIFMSVIVALFIGLTVSAEEIIKDRKILKREAFLNLSRSSYLASKVAILLVLSAYQALVFVLIGNTIMEIKGMYFHYWLILFSTWVAANMLGLNISDAFKTSVTIYILIPFLIIPQIILSGVLVKFDKLNPDISSPNKIPFYGEMIISRWAYEALAVYQFKENAYEKPLYPYEKEMYMANVKKDYWIRQLDNKIVNYERNKDKPEKFKQIEDDFEVLRNELSEEVRTNRSVTFYGDFDSLYREKVSTRQISLIKNYFNDLRIYFTRVYNENNKIKDQYVVNQQKNETEKEAYTRLKREQHNENLADFVTNSSKTGEIERFVEFNGRLYQKSYPVFLDPKHPFVKAHFYAPRKKIFGWYVDTFWVNVIVVWIQSMVLYITLYYSFLRKILEFSEYLNRKYKFKQESKVTQSVTKQPKNKSIKKRMLRWIGKKRRKH